MLLLLPYALLGLANYFHRRHDATVRSARRTSANIPLPRTRLSKGSKLLYVAYVEPLRGRETLARKGVRADERASSQSGEQGHPAVGRGSLLQQRAYVGGPRLLRRGGHLHRAQGQGEWHSALHIRDDRGLEDRRGRTVPRLPGGLERAQRRRTPHGRTSGSVKLHSPVTTLGQ